MDKDIEKVYNENQRLVYYVVHKRFSNYIKDEDLIQEGNIGLFRAIKTYDPDKGISFSTYAVSCINHAILKYLRVPQKVQGILQNTVYYEAPVSDDDNHTFSNMDLSYEDSSYDTIEDLSYLEYVKSKLTKRDWTLIYKYFSGTTQTELSEEFHMPQAAISREIKRIILKIRRMK